MSSANKKITSIKKKYYARFASRVVVFIATILLYVFYPNAIDTMLGFNIFTTFNVMHIFYILWIIDITMQFLPLTGHFSIGSLKHFQKYMKSIKIKDELSNIKLMIRKQIEANKGAFKVLVVWLILTIGIGLLKIFHIISHREIFIISSFFYLCDLICVLFFCPFQKWFMHNKCCATCRIFNWDHMMMFSPFIFVIGFYSWSLVLLSLISMLIWEFTYYAHPERFFEESNENLRCKNCKEKMCRR